MITIEATDAVLKIILSDALERGDRCRLGGRRDGVTFKPTGAAAEIGTGKVTFQCVAETYDTALPRKRKAKVKRRLPVPKRA